MAIAVVCMVAISHRECVLRDARREVVTRHTTATVNGALWRKHCRDLWPHNPAQALEALDGKDQDAGEES